MLKVKKRLKNSLSVNDAASWKSKRHNQPKHVALILSGTVSLVD